MAEQLVAFRARPDFRLVEISGIPVIDVSQTPFPDKWRELPVYRWDTATPFRMEERMRGMGMQKPEGLSIARELWLDQDGGGLTFRDHITGTCSRSGGSMPRPRQDLGSVRADGEGQLITRNPQTGAAGVEVRTRGSESGGHRPHGAQRHVLRHRLANGCRRLERDAQPAPRLAPVRAVRRGLGAMATG